MPHNVEKTRKLFAIKKKTSNFAFTMTENMAKKLRIVVLSALLLAAPLGVRAQSGLEGDTDTELQSVSLSISGSHVSVSGAEGQVLEIYNLTGVKIATYRIDSDSKQLSLAGLPGGYYILKVGSVVRKISIR